MNAEKLAKLQAQVRIGGKGTARRKVKRTTGNNIGGDDKKLVNVIKQLNLHPLSDIQEVNMFLVKGARFFILLLHELGPDSLASLRKLAETYQSMNPDQAEDD
ncbi:Nascent polypeptide-associated complex subunit beta [Massospora cicadina]|nr:Nascent polypeptide-associated complex subunit beta [Massospora cicadina]